MYIWCIAGVRAEATRESQQRARMMYYMMYLDLQSKSSWLFVTMLTKCTLVPIGMQDLCRCIEILIWCHIHYNITYINKKVKYSTHAAVFQLPARVFSLPTCIQYSLLVSWIHAFRFRFRIQPHLTLPPTCSYIQVHKYLNRETRYRQGNSCWMTP
jgi:hypothetical protein